VFDIGWTEMLVVAVVMILVVGPKDLPGMLRTIGKSVGNVRRMASDFQRQFSDALKEADIDEVKKEISGATSFSNPLEDINKSAEELMGSIDVDDSADGASEADIYANKEQDIAADVAGVKPVGTPAKRRKTSKGDAILAKKIAAGKKSAAKTAASKASTAKRPTAKTSTAKTLAAKSAAARKSTSTKSGTKSATKSAARKPAAKSKAKIGSKSA
jgi:sec-independent protein translocase protein TatB